jgi:3-oxoacyl-[acyl-carrier protein] reductase
MNPPASLELVEHTAVVTGAGRGIGRAIARRLAAAGAELVLVGRNEERLFETARLIAEQDGKARVLCADVTDAGFTAALHGCAPELDIVVCNAAAYAPFAYLEKCSEHDFERVFATVVHATRRLIQHVIGGMKARGFGRVVCVGSLASELGGKGQAPYASAKAALAGLIRTTAIESARFGVTANLVLPGLIDTERVAEAIDSHLQERILGRVPARRKGTPEEVAQAVAFLVSPASGYVTGTLLPVAGGLGLGLFPEGDG